MIRFSLREKLTKKADTLKINLIGWYGKGGLADDVIQYCTKTVFYDEASQKGIQLEYVDSLDCDLIVIGGGSLLGFDCLKIAEKIKRARAPIVIYGTGFRMEKRILDNLNQRSTIGIMERASLKGLRGFLSKVMLLHNEISIDGVEVIGDPALLFKPIPVDDFQGKFKVGMVVRNLNPYVEPQYVSNERIQQIFSKIGDYLVENFAAKIYFFSFTENFNESDLEGARKTVEMMRHRNHTEIMKRIDDHVVLCSMLGKMDFLVSQRLHPSLLGWVQGIPCIAFEYQFNKTIDFMNSIGMDEFVVRTNEFVLETYEKKLDALLKEKQVILNQSQKAIDYWRSKQKEFAKRCIELAVNYREKKKQ